jgi:hypothetical protein
MFKRDFAHYVCEGDGITCEVDGFDCVATLYRDDCTDRPDQRQDGFWPSRDPKDAGYIGEKSVGTFNRHRRHAREVMEAWKRDEWFYCGVAVTVSKDGVPLTHEYGNALWGIEANYPPRFPLAKKNPNRYLRTVANELLPDALADARAKLEKLFSIDALADKIEELRS